MIRNVVVGKLKDGASREDAEKALAAIAALELEGCLDMRVGVDAGLREGNWDYSITADFTDADAYRRLRPRRGAQPHPAGDVRADQRGHRAHPVRGLSGAPGRGAYTPVRAGSRPDATAAANAAWSRSFWSA